MTLSSPQVCKATGCTYRQLDYWTRQGWVIAKVEAKGSGSQREYDGVTVERIKEAIALIAVGFMPEIALKITWQLFETGAPLVLGNRLVTIWAPRALREE